MKNLLTTLTIICAFISFSQTSQEHLKAGVEKHKQQDYSGAIIHYNKAIKEDKSNGEAYFNRGTCELALKDYKSAMTDFNKTIELNPKYTNAYYSRASVYVSQEKYTEALPDLDKTIELDPKTPNALTLRGQIRAQTGNKDGACKDFNQAREIGDKQAVKYLAQFCGNEPQVQETLELDWPESEKWKIGVKQQNEQMTMVEFIHSDETLEKWTELGTMTTIHGAKNIPLDKIMNITFDQAKQNSPKSVLTFIEKDETAEYPWIIFTIESPNFKDDKTPESQLWYIIQGKQALYTNFRAVKQASISSESKEKWITFFKTSEIVNK